MLMCKTAFHHLDSEKISIQLLYDSYPFHVISEVESEDLSRAVAPLSSILFHIADGILKSSRGP
ncbi:hypothetical protein EMIT0P228_90115 [Pseudomonas brassicacearum]